MKKFKHPARQCLFTLFTLSVFTFAFFFHPPAAMGQVVVPTLGSPYTQNFDTLPASGSATWTNNSTIPGWFHARTGTGTTIVANDGSSNAGNLYSYGTGAATERALGSLGSGNAAVGNLFWGVRLQNNSGSTITSLDVTYTGEQWRNSAAAAQTVSFSYLVGSPTVTGSLAEFQLAGVAVPQLDFTSPVTGGTAGALNGNLAANRTTLTHTITGLSIPNGTEIMLRWSDPDQTGSDHGLSIDDLTVTANAGGGSVQPSLSINDVSLAEGNAGTTTFPFTVSLSTPAPAGGVTFDITTANGTATVAGGDYIQNSLTGQTIPAGSSTYTFNVLVNGDTTTEPNETFFVNVTNVTGATVADGQGLGTITNDDVSLVAIHDIQGAGASSPLVGQSVVTRGIVTGVKSNGFFIQEPDATVDANPATSEAVFVFTSSAPPAAAAVGNLVQVSATVIEFVPAADPLQAPLTELTSPSVSTISTGNTLPTAVTLTATFPSPTGSFDQLERVEGMRVSVPSFTLAAPTGGTVSEPNATATSTGVFFGTVTGVARPFRESGIQAPDPPPAGTIPPIPRWDFNPELLRVDSDGLTGTTALNLNTGTVLSNLVGPLDYTFRRYTILPETTPATSGGITATAAVAPTAREFTVSSYNLERFFDTVNDPGIGEPVLTAAAFDRRLNKASLGIRNFLNTPDILGVVEVENLSTLQSLADRINSDAVAASQPNPNYVAYLVEGNDVGGIDVGFLVKTGVVTGSTPRVTVGEVVQELDNSVLINPDNSTDILNDRPPLRLNATVNYATGEMFPVTVIVNHLRSLNDADSTDPGSNGWATTGARVRAKRQKQAEDLANLVQARQTANPSERIVLVGDFNAFEFNDGLGDLMGTIQGTPSPDNQTAVTGDGADLVNPDLTNLSSTEPPSERYSFVFDGNAQSLDHVLVNQALISATTARKLDHARINADFPQTARNVTTVERLADHDPLIAYFAIPAASANLSVTNVDSPDPVAAGGNLSYAITVNNAGPNSAATVSLTDTLPANTTFVSLASPAGWNCTTPAVGGIGNVTCTNPSLAVGNAAFTLVVKVSSGTASGTVISNTATVSSATSDPTPGNESATATTTVTTSADLAVTITDAPDPVTAGTNLVYTIGVANNGPSDAATVAFTDTLPAGTTFVSLSQTGAAFSCTPPAVGSGGTVSCTKASLAAGATTTFTLTVRVAASVQQGTTISNTVSVSSATSDPSAANNSATATTSVSTSTDLALQMTSTSQVQAGGNLIYTIRVNNNGPSEAANVVLTNPIPAGTTYQSVSFPAGWKCRAPTGTRGSVRCTRVAFAVGDEAVFAIRVRVNPTTPAGTTIFSQATVATDTAETNLNNNGSSTTTIVTAGSGGTR